MMAKKAAMLDQEGEIKEAFRIFDKVGYTVAEIMHSSANFNILPFRYISFVRVIMFITNRKYAFFCIFYRSDCHLAIITPIHWVLTDLVLFQMIMTDNLGTVYSCAVSLSAPTVLYSVTLQTYRRFD